jgi:hypothetical protein
MAGFVLGAEAGPAVMNELPERSGAGAAGRVEGRGELAGPPLTAGTTRREDLAIDAKTPGGDPACS